MAAPARLPTDIEETIAACEAQVESDSSKIQESIDSLDSVPDEEWDDPSFVRQVEDVRKSVLRGTNAATRARDSIPLVVSK